MLALQVLGAVLSIQAQALSLGAPVEPFITHTQLALCWQLSEFTARTLGQDRPKPTGLLLPLRVTGGEPVTELAPSPWDPDPPSAIIMAGRCRALLLEIIRRAAHDWVLYRNSRRPERAYAADAYTWLFEEDEEHPWGRERKLSGEHLTSFLSICEVMDLDPKVVRKRVRRMTVKDIMTAGRPAERRYQKRDDLEVEDYTSPKELDDYMHEGTHYHSSYEAQFAVACLGK